MRPFNERPSPFQRADILLYHFDARVVARSEGKFAVARKQRRIERFCQCYVQGIVGSQVVAQLPNAPQKQDMRMAPNPKIQQVL
jgi:hypothetical protein